MMGGTAGAVGVRRRPVRAAIGIYPIVVLLFGSWAAVAMAGAGGALRPAFPVAAAAVAGWLLHAGRRADYVALVFWLFMLTPGLRRLVDLHSGWSQVNLLMLAPYAAGALCIWPAAKALWRHGFAYSSLFAVVLLCTLYGLVLAAIDNRFFAAAFETIRWVVPPCLGLFIATDPERQEEYRDVIVRTMVVALLVLSLYGVYQFIVAPPWDRFWMQESKLLSIGFPEPFQIRVFGTMNSPASLASFLTAGLLWCVSSRLVLRPLALGAGLVGLLLTLVRTSWLGLLVGVAFLIVFGASARARLSIIVGIFCLPVVLMAVEQIPTGADMINTRISSLSDVGNDTSYLDRSNEYSSFFNDLLPAAPFGSGLGINGAYQTYVDHGSSMVVDGAFMEIGLSLGVFGGGAYLLAVLATAGIACWRSLRSGDTFLSSCGAIVASLALTLVAGNVAVGESGILFWVAASFCLMPRRRMPAPA